MGGGGRGGSGRGTVQQAIHSKGRGWGSGLEVDRQCNSGQPEKRIRRAHYYSIRRDEFTIVVCMIVWPSLRYALHCFLSAPC